MAMAPNALFIVLKTGTMRIVIVMLVSMRKRNETWYTLLIRVPDSSSLTVDCHSTLHCFKVARLTIPSMLLKSSMRKPLTKD
jgi:hypothetical protein